MSDQSNRKKVPTVTVSPKAGATPGFNVSNTGVVNLPVAVAQESDGQNQTRGRWLKVLCVSTGILLFIITLSLPVNKAPQIVGNLSTDSKLAGKSEVAESRVWFAGRGRTGKIKFEAGVENTTNLSLGRLTTDVSIHPGFWEGDTPLARLPMPRVMSSAFRQLRRLPVLLLVSSLGATKRVAAIVDRAVAGFVLRVKTLAECFDQSLVLLVQPPGTAELLLLVDAGNWAGARAWVLRKPQRSPTFWKQDSIGNTLVHRLLRAKHHQHKHRDATAEIDHLVIAVLRRAGEGLADVQDWMGQTAMHLIARQNDFKLAKVLLNQSPALNLEVNKTNVFGATALQVALSRGSQEMVDVLSPLCNVINATALVGIGHYLLDVAFFCTNSLHDLCF